MYSILLWENMLNCLPNPEVDVPHLQLFHFSDTTSYRGVATSASKVDIMGRMRHLTIKIYREMLCITRDLQVDGPKCIRIDGFDDDYCRP